MQLSLDLDGPAHHQALADLLAAGEQPGIIARTAYLAAYRLAHGSFDLYAKIARDTPWLPWRIGTTSPGGTSSVAELVEAQADGCRPTVLDVFVEDPLGRHHLWRGACLGCDWEGTPHLNDENIAVEDAHDHVYPDWWRTLPAVTRPRSDNPKARRRWADKVAATYEAAAPGCTSHPAGCPVWTKRDPIADRHHVGGPLGGYDLGRALEEKTP